MKDYKEIENHDRVYQFRAYLPIDGAYSFIYTFKDRHKSCTVLISQYEKIENRKAVEHASFSIMGKGDPLPTWEQMCETKDLIWQDEEECYQVFPKKAEYVHGYRGLNNVMHIWRDIPEENKNAKNKD